MGGCRVMLFGVEVDTTEDNYLQDLVDLSKSSKSIPDV